MRPDTNSMTLSAPYPRRATVPAATPTESDTPASTLTTTWAATLSASPRRTSRVRTWSWSSGKDGSAFRSMSECMGPLGAQPTSNGSRLRRAANQLDERLTFHVLYSSPDMLRRRGIAGLASGILLLQLVLVGGGFACVIPGMGTPGAAATSETSAMPGMDMPSAPSELPCQLPWAPAGCQPMAPCAPAAVTAARFVLALPVVDAAPVAALDIATPSSRTTPPEIPPPRA